MSGIVCAVRGGPASQPTLQRAITLAKETGLPLFFLYVVNLDFSIRPTAAVPTPFRKRWPRWANSFC